MSSNDLVISGGVASVTYTPFQVTTNGYSCVLCGLWVVNGQFHICAGQTQRVPHKCPVCDGWGERPTRATVGSGTNTETCQACNGAGVLWA